MTLFEELTEPASEDAPHLDRISGDRTILGLTEEQASWVKDGVVHLKNFIPEALIDAYHECWLDWHSVAKMSGRSIKRPGGWASPTPYMAIPEIKNVSLYPPLMRQLESLIGEAVGLHLNLTGWVSTERTAHVDSYLNPPQVNAWYLATWIALDQVHPDSGPFQYIAGSHRWPPMRRERVLAKLTPEEAKSPAWPSIAERIVTPAYDEEIARRGATWTEFLGAKGDVLIWHANLVHRGSEPKDKSRYRKTLISHYSALSRRTDMPRRAKWNGENYFVHDNPIDPKVSG